MRQTVLPRSDGGTPQPELYENDLAEDATIDARRFDSVLFRDGSLRSAFDLFDSRAGRSHHREGGGRKTPRNLLHFLPPRGLTFSTTPMGSRADTNLARAPEHQDCPSAAFSQRQQSLREPRKKPFTLKTDHRSHGNEVPR